MSKINFNKSNNIFSYWHSQVRTNGVWNVLMRATKYARRYLFISRLIKYASLIIAFIETSATLVVVATGFVIAIPAAILSVAITVLFSFSKFKRINPLIEKDLENADKIVFIEAKKGYFRKKPAYLNHMANTFREEGYTVIIVSRSFITDRMLSARKTENGVWVIMLNYYFVVKKKFLSDKTDKITYIY